MCTMFPVEHVCTFPKLTLKSWEGRLFHCVCGLTHRYTNGVFVAVGRYETPYDTLTRVQVEKARR
jgi:hypothetical protein